jgi:hypothetical protein
VSIASNFDFLGRDVAFREKLRKSFPEKDLLCSRYGYAKPYFRKFFEGV